MISKVNVFVVHNSIDYLIDIHDTSSLFIQMTCRFFCLRYYSDKKMKPLTSLTILNKSDCVWLQIETSV